jgi:hypothetical protein
VGVAHEIDGHGGTIAPTVWPAATLMVRLAATLMVRLAAMPMVGLAATLTVPDDSSARVPGTADPAN